MTAVHARYCLGCGYDLHALPTPRCPECGRAYDPADPATFNNSPDALRRDRFKRFVSHPLTVLVPAWVMVWLAPLSMFGYAIAMTAITRWSWNRRWRHVTIGLVLFPSNLYACQAVVEYVAGTARPRTVGLMRGGPIRRIDPEYRCPWTSSGCVLTGDEWISHDLYNFTLRSMIRLFGPMRGSYTGPYPREAEAFQLARSGTQISKSALKNDSVSIAGQTITLQQGNGRDFLDIVPMATCGIPHDEKQAGPILANLLDGQCLLLRVPVMPCETGYAAVVLLIDAKTGRAFATYREPQSLP